MNSTEQAQLEELMGTLFDEVLLPVSERMRAQGVKPFPLTPDVSWLSYYIKRRRGAMARDDFSSAACADAAEFERRLAACWHALGRHELAAQAPRFAAAAQAARPLVAATEPGAEPSPYVYAMF